MKIINKIFIDMLLLSIEGGLVSIIFFIFQKKIYKYTSATFTAMLNILSILCFVTPFFKIISYKDYSYAAFYNKDMIISVHENTMQKIIYTTIKDINIANITTLIWFIGFIIYIIVGIISYIYFLKNIKNDCSILTNRLWIDTFIKLSSKDSSRKYIKLMVSNLLFQPCTTGIGTKMIIIPSYLLNVLSNEEIEIILTHELNHIKKRDILSKLFIYFLNSLNWFNPLFYLLRKNLSDLMEIRCDEDLTIYKDLKQRKVYVNILIKLHEIKFINAHQQNIIYFSTKESNILKRRIWCIMKKIVKEINFQKALFLY